MNNLFKYLLGNPKSDAKVILSNIDKRAILSGKYVREDHKKTMYLLNGTSSYISIQDLDYTNYGLVCVFKGLDGPLVSTDHLTIHKEGNNIKVIDDSGLKNTLLMPNRSNDNTHQLAFIYKLGDPLGFGDKTKTNITINIDGITYDTIYIDNLGKTNTILLGTSHHKEASGFFKGYIGAVYTNGSISGRTTSDLYEMSHLIEMKDMVKPTTSTVPVSTKPVQDGDDTTKTEPTTTKPDPTKADVAIMGRLRNQLDKINDLTKLVKEKKSEIKVKDVKALHKLHETVEKMIIDKTSDFSEHQHNLDHSIQEHKLAEIEAELQRLQVLSRSKNIMTNIDREFLSIYNPLFGRGLNVKRTYTSKDNAKYVPSSADNTDLKLTGLSEEQCFNKCNLMNKCTGATYMMTNDAKQNKCNITTSNEMSGNELVNNNGTSAITKGSTYNLFLNEGCMYSNYTLDSNGDPLPDYGTTNCQLNLKNQQFNIRKIANLPDYNDAIKYDSDKIKEAEFSSVSTPFYVINPARNDEAAANECLTLDKNGDISVEPCNLSNYQRWQTSGRERTC